MAAPAVVVRLSTMFRWISGMAIPTALTTRVPHTARITLCGYRQQYPASRAIQPRSRAAEPRAPAGSRARSVVVSLPVLSSGFLSVAGSFPAHVCGRCDNAYQKNVRVVTTTTNVGAARDISAPGADSVPRAGSAARGRLGGAVPGGGAEHDQHEQGERDHVDAGAPQADRADGE